VTHLGRGDPSVVALAGETMIDLKDGGLGLEREEVETFENCKCCRRLGVADRRREPAGTKKLNRVGECRFTIAKVNANGMNALGVDDHKIVGKCGFGIMAHVAHSMAKLDTQPKGFQ